MMYYLIKQFKEPNKIGVIEKMQHAAHFPAQAYWLTHSQALTDLFTKYELSSLSISELNRYAEQFKVRVPFVGPFSAGKSSLLNALLETKQFATSNDPQTALPAEIIFSAEPVYQARLADGTHTPLNAETVLNNDLGTFSSDTFLEVGLPVEFLQAIPHLCLVDMPGWDSGNNEHGKAIDQYITKSSAYCIVISVEDGTLHESIAEALEELKLHATPIILLINKIDKVSEDDIEKSVDVIEREVERILGKETFATIAVSARPKREQGIESVKDALIKIEQRADQLFNLATVKPILIQLHNLESHLDKLANQDDVKSETLRAERQRLAEEKNLFLDKLQQETQILEQRTQSVAHYVLEEIRNKLMSQLDYFVDTLSYGGSIESNVTQIIRVTITEAMQTKFSDEMQRFIGRMSDELAYDFSINLPNETSSHATSSTSSMDFLNSLKYLISPVLFVLPLGKVIAPIATAIFTVFDLNRSSKDEDFARRMQEKESQKSKFSHSIIPNILHKVESNFVPLLNQKVQEIKHSISKKLTEQIDNLDQTLATLELDLSKGEDEFKRAQAVYQTDLALVKTTILDLEEYVNAQ